MVIIGILRSNLIAKTNKFGSLQVRCRVERLEVF